MDSVRFCGAQRIGHGVRLTENEDLMKFIVDRRIAIEVVCLCLPLFCLKVCVMACAAPPMSED